MMASQPFFNLAHRSTFPMDTTTTTITTTAAASTTESEFNQLLDNLTWQMWTSSQATKRLKTSMTPASTTSSISVRAAGSPTKIIKPGSTSNSPRSAVSMMHRRSTMMNENAKARNVHQTTSFMSAPPLAAAASVVPSSSLNLPRRSTGRPMSWHPGCFERTLQSQQPLPQVSQAPQIAQLSQYPFPSQPEFNSYGTCGVVPSYSPTPASFSCNASPSPFLPMDLPAAGYDTPDFMDTMGWSLAQQQTPSYLSTPMDTTLMAFPEPFPTFDDNSLQNNTLFSDGLDWNSFALPMFPVNAPPTPEIIPQQHLPQQSMTAAGLEEEEGEVLVGMGLYDDTDKLIDDPQLDHSRSSMSMLMGAMPTGKGLKLEETWQPPESDDDDEEDEDNYDDGDVQSTLKAE